MSPDDNIKTSPESSAQSPSSPFSIWQHHRYWIIGAIVVAFIIVIYLGGLFFSGRNGSQFSINSNLPDTPYAALYACGAKLSEEIGIFRSDSLDALSLTGDLLFVLNQSTGEMYFYTPKYAGRTVLDLNQQTSNFLIPHLSNDTVGSGYFYVSTADHEYSANHDVRINYLGFIAGDKQSNPDFSKVSTKTLRVGGMSSAPQGVQFQSLPIESQMWASSESLESSSVAMLSKVILGVLPDLHREAYRGCPGLGCPSRAEVQRTGDKIFKEVTALCETAGQKNNNQQILNAVAAARGNAESNPSDYIPTAVENVIKKAGEPYITLSKQSGHADYTSYSYHAPSTTSSVGIDQSQADTFLYKEVADKASFRELELVAYAADNAYGYHWAFGMTAGDPPVHWEKIPNSDGKTFRYIGGPYAADKNHVYFETPYIISTISNEPTAFTVVDMTSGISKDSKTVYFADQPITGADPSTISIIETNSPYYGAVKDRNYLYIIIRGSIDTNTLYRLPAGETANLTSGT